MAKKALDQGKWRLNIVDLKKFPVKSDRIDSEPYGGGAGMILSPISFAQAIESLTENEKKWKKIYFSPRGRQMTQVDLQDLSNSTGITLLCGRYEGVDQRIIDCYEMEEISIGDFVLLGGEVAAMAIIEGCVRLLPTVIGNDCSLWNDSFQHHLLEYDQYTRPAVFKEFAVPEVLRHGNHQKIAKFQLNQSKELTRKRRPDLWGKYINFFLKKIVN